MADQGHWPPLVAVSPARGQGKHHRRLSVVLPSPPAPDSDSAMLAEAHRFYPHVRGKETDASELLIPISPHVPPPPVGTLEPALVIELDDASHELAERRQRDALVDAIYARSSLPILHVPVTATFDPRDLAGRIRSALGLPALASTVGRPVPAHSPSKT